MPRTAFDVGCHLPHRRKSSNEVNFARKANNLLTQYLVLILPLIASQIFSFLSDDSRENFANAKAFKLISLFLSKHCFPRVLPVLLVCSSCFMKNRLKKFEGAKVGTGFTLNQLIIFFLGTEAPQHDNVHVVILIKNLILF